MYETWNIYIFNIALSILFHNTFNIYFNQLVGIAFKSRLNCYPNNQATRMDTLCIYASVKISFQCGNWQLYIYAFE